MAYIKYAGEEAVGRIADYVNKKLAFASSMPESPDANTIILYVGATTSAYKQGGIYQYDGTEWNLINLVKTIELTQAEYDALPSAAKLNGTIYFVTDGSADGSIISGYYNETDGEFYAEDTYETQYDHHSNTIYIDLPNNTTYIYDFENEEYVQVGGSGSGTVIKYVNTLPVTGIEDIIYGYNSTTSYDEVTAEGFLDTDDNFIKNENTYTAKSGIIIEASADGVNYNTFTSLEYDENNSEFILTYGDSTSETIAVGGTFYWKVYAKLYYAGNASEQNLTLLAGSGGGGGGVTYAAGTGIKIEGNIISGDYKADFGIDITDDKIKTTDFVGTQAEWNALSAEDKAKYDFIHITDDTSSIVYKPGHSISDGTTEKTQRDGLVFEGFTVTDDSTNEVTKITDIPYTAGDGIEIDNHEVSVTEDRPATFVGTTQEWDALTTAEKAQYKVVNLTNDIVGGETVVVDTVESGNLNPVTSNAVYGALALKANLTQISNPNLLDNPWFTVNQRGLSSYTNTWSYTLDRWINLALSEVNVVDDGVQLVRGSSSDVNSGTILQKIEENVVKLLDGKTITISALLSNGALVTSTGTFVYKGGYDQLSKTSNGTTINITSNSAGTENSFKVVCADTNSNITVRAIKLELGSVSTLAMDTAPNYATELLKCQRYFYKTEIEIKQGSQTTSKLAVATNTNFLTGVDFPVQMRVQPTYSNVKAQDFFGTVLIDNIVFETSTKDGVCRFYKQNAFTTGTWYYMQFEASADL